LGGKRAIEIAEAPLGGLGSIDPDIFRFLFDIAQKALEIVAGAARELVSGVLLGLKGLGKAERPASIRMTIGQTQLAIPADPTPEEVEATMQSDTFRFLFDIAQKVLEIVAGAARELVSGVLLGLKGLGKAERPASIRVTIGQTELVIPADPTPEGVEATMQSASGTIGTMAAGNSSTIR